MSVLRPTVGNHDLDNGFGEAYFNNFGKNAGEKGKGYYSYDLGEWKVIALNSEIVVPRLAAVEGLLLRDRQLEVHADVDDDARGAERLHAEHAQVVVRHFEEAQLGHEPFGVERPAFAVAGDERHHPLVTRQVEALRAARLQVMAGHAFVVDGRDVGPLREAGARPGRKPGAARTREVL